MRRKKYFRILGFKNYENKHFVWKNSSRHKKDMQ